MSDQKTIIVKYGEELAHLLDKKGYEYSIEKAANLSKGKAVHSDLTKHEIELPSIYEPYFDFFETYFWIERKDYLERVIKREIESRNSELGIF